MAGVISTATVAVKDQCLAIPHISVPDIRWIDWEELRRSGFKGVVFDKDNTLTLPYSLSIFPSISPALRLCNSVFDGNIAILSNSAGLSQYDPCGSLAKSLEDSLGVSVIRHATKKPAGTAEDLERHFGCEASLLVVVGDRSLTDIVYGNRSGCLTILTEPLSLVEEPYIVRQVRKLENYMIDRWCRDGMKPVDHCLHSAVKQCVKDPFQSVGHRK